MIIELEKNGDRVFHNGVELKINPQATKGPGKEVIDIEKLVGPEWQKYVSLSRLAEGLNEVELKPRKVVNSYQYTKDELDELERLNARIDEIKELASKRQPKKWKPVTQMNPDELIEYIEYLNSLKENLQ